MLPAYLKSRSKQLLASRVLAALLLAAISWGSTFEFTHHHGVDGSRQFQTGQSATKADAGVARTSIQRTESSPLSSRSNTSECSICQLHHNLATTVISKLADTRYDVAQTAYVTAATAIHLSEFTATRHGRAPPALL